MVADTESEHCVTHQPPSAGNTHIEHCSDSVSVDLLVYEL